MTSVVEIGNIALVNLGEDTITSLSDDVKAARLINRRYAPIRDAVLRAHPWNCAMARAQLASTDPAPAWGPAACYQLPTDCLRVLRLEDRSIAWKVEGRKVVADGSAPLNILYVRQVDDPNAFDPLLIEAIAARLAADLAHPITHSTTLVQVMWDLYRQKLIEARGVDGQEGTGDAVIANTWLSSRSVGVGNPFGSDEAF